MEKTVDLDHQGLKTSINNCTDLILYLNDIISYADPKISESIQNCLMELAYRPILYHDMNLNVTLFCIGLTLRHLRSKPIHDAIWHHLLCDYRPPVQETNEFFNWIMERFFLGKDLSMQNGSFDLSAYLLVNQIKDDAEDPYLELHAFITKAVDIDKNFNLDNLLI